jgi:hypothetical protein
VAVGPSPCMLTARKCSAVKSHRSAPLVCVFPERKTQIKCAQTEVYASKTHFAMKQNMRLQTNT